MACVAEQYTVKQYRPLLPSKLQFKKKKKIRGRFDLSLRPKARPKKMTYFSGNTA